MTFRVNFHSNDADAVTCDALEGLAALDAARQLTGVPDLDMALVEGSSRQKKTSHFAELSEAQARRCGLFADKNGAQVDTDADIIRSFQKPVIFNVRKHGTTGAVERVTVWNAIDEAAMVAAWEAAGFPSPWTQTH